MRRADAAARVRSKVAPPTIAGGALTERGIFPGDLRPVAFELFRDKLAEAGEHPLPHLRARNADNHSVVGFEDHPGIDLIRTNVGAADALATARNA